MSTPFHNWRRIKRARKPHQCRNCNRFASENVFRLSGWSDCNHRFECDHYCLRCTREQAERYGWDVPGLDAVAA